MNIKNSFLVCTNNFLLVLKQLVYSLIIGLIVALCLYGLTSPIVKILRESGWVADVKSFFSGVYTDPKSIANSFNDLARRFFEIFIDNFDKLWGNYIFSMCVIVLVPIFAGNLSTYCLGDVVNAKMNSWVNYGYVNRFFSGLKKNIIYSLYMVLFTLPALAVITLLIIAYGKLSSSFLLATALLPVLVIACLTVLALKNTFTMWIMPSCLNEDGSVAKSIRKSFVMGFQNFGKTLFASFLLYLIEFFLITFGGVFTLGAGLFVILPAISVTNTVFGVINYYNVEKLRYYINEFTIVSPNEESL